MQRLRPCSCSGGRSSAAAAFPARPPSIITPRQRAPAPPPLAAADGAAAASPRRRRSVRARSAAEEAPSGPAAQQRPPASNDADGDDSDPTRLSDLRARLSLAVRDEDYAAAALLRDALSKAGSDARLALADANAAFYAAFASGDAPRMARVWADGDHVQVVHPGAPPIAGRKAVDASWRAILSGVRPGAFRISAEDVRVVIAGGGVGVVSCVEVVEADDGRGRTVATNVFERVEMPGGPPGGAWRMTLHHGSPMALGRR